MTGRSGAGALANHRLLGMNFDRGLLEKIIEVKDCNAKIAAGVRGLAVIIDADQQLTDEQISDMSTSPVVCLMLDGMRYISAEQARTLAGFGGRSLSLNGLLWVGCPQIRELVKFAGDYLSLNEIRRLTEEQAQELGQFEGRKLVLELLDGGSQDSFNRHRTDRTAVLITSLN